jgi:hypothetical protein
MGASSVLKVKTSAFALRQSPRTCTEDQQEMRVTGKSGKYFVSIFGYPW